MEVIRILEIMDASALRAGGSASVLPGIHRFRLLRLIDSPGMSMQRVDN